MHGSTTAIEAYDLIKDFGDKRAVDGVSLAVPAGAIYGILGPNGAGKTTTLRMLLGIIAFMGALRGLPLREGKRRGRELMVEHGLGDWAGKPIRTLSKGMAQTVQLLGTIVHKPRLIVLDEPFSGLDAINQGKLETLIRREAAAGTTIIFSTHVIAHAERLCERVAIIAEGKVAFEGLVDEARDRLRPIVRLRTRASDGPWRSAIPANARQDGGEWTFELPSGGPEPLLRALLDGGAGIETLAIERPGLHDAFVAIAGEAAAEAMGQATPIEEAA